MSDELRVEAPFGLVEGDHEERWHGHYRTVDGSPLVPFEENDVAEVLHQGKSADEWDGIEAAVVRLKDGRLAAWESWYGPTGSGFSEDAYGGDADVWFAQAERSHQGNLPDGSDTTARSGVDTLACA